MSVLGGMNLGGGGQAKKIQLVTDLREEYNKLNQVLQKTKELSADIAANMKAGKGSGAFAVAGGSGPGVPQMPGAGTLNGFVQPPNTNQQAAAEAASGMSFSKFVKGAFATLVGGGAVAAQALPTNQQAIERSITEARLNFMRGSNSPSGRSAVSTMMNNGLGTSPEDGNRAAMMGLSAGMIGTNAQNAAAQFSNLAPGVGLQGGMNAAIGLNQAASVNRLRMVGINVRGADGMMREPTEIANDLWKQMVAAAGGKKITKDAIAFSLQPGHALGSYINQYFSATPELRMAIINALMAKAGGAELDKESLKRAGLITPIMTSEGERNAAANDLGAKVVDEQIKGIVEANTILIKASETFEKHVDRFGNVITQISKGETLLGGGNNAVSTAVGTVGGLLGVGFGAKMFKGLFNSKAGTAVKTGLGKRFAIAAALIAAVAGVAKLITDNNDDNEESEDQGDGSRNVYGVGGDSGSTGNTVQPLSGSPKISSPFGQVRHLTFNGKKSPSYGQPHGGVDFAVSTGTPVMAANDGVVVGTPYDADGFGNYVQVQHRDGHSSYYGHLASKGVSEGQEVTAGQVVGVSGNSGNSTGPHLHFEVRRGGIKVDPLGYLSGAASASPGEVGSQTSGSPVGIGIQGANLFEKKAAVNLFTPTSAGDGSSGGGTIYTNYGGVTVNINVPGGTKLDEKKLAREIKTILANEDAIKMAVSR